jgi:hypothetical protein
MTRKKKSTAASEEKAPTPWELFKADPVSMAAICTHVASGESLASFAKARDFPYVTVLDWIEADKIRAENYARAKDARADLTFDELDDVSTQAVGAKTTVEVQGLRLKSDNIKWKLARMAPKKYGEKVQVGGADDLPPVQLEAMNLRGLQPDELDTLKRLLAKGKEALESGAA